MNRNTNRGDKRLDIKKYTNRRYYDTTHSRHLTLEEIRSLVQQGYDIRVTDAKTSTDITRQILTQIILELDKPKLDSFPVPLLVRLIRVNDDLVKDFIEKYFNQALDSFLNYQGLLEEQMRQTHGLKTGLPTMAEWTKTMLTPFAPTFGETSQERHLDPKRAHPQEEASQVSGDLREMINELKKEVDELKGNARRRKARK